LQENWIRNYFFLSYTTFSFSLRSRDHAHSIGGQQPMYLVRRQQKLARHYLNIDLDNIPRRMRRRRRAKEKERAPMRSFVSHSPSDKSSSPEKKDEGRFFKVVFVVSFDQARTSSKRDSLLPDGKIAAICCDNNRLRGQMFTNG
jgi:hypothetical protein